MEWLFREFYADMCRSAFRILRDSNLAEDLAQEVFFELWRSRSRLRIKGSVGAYLRRAVVNRSLNYLRDQRLPLSDQSPAELPLADDRTGAQQRLERDELEQAIQRAIDQLPERCRIVFVLNRFEDLSNKEIADRLDISVKTVENQMTRALRLLRSQLSRLITLVLSVTLLIWQPQPGQQLLRQGADTKKVVFEMPSLGVLPHIRVIPSGEEHYG